MTENDPGENMDLDWENRVLCSDESCVGTIGPDGRCRECGRPYAGTLPWAARTPLDERSTLPSDAPLPVADGARMDGPPLDHPSDHDDTDGPVGDDEWEQRTLCEDESCIGTIGPDGRCTECGRRYGGKD